MLHKTLSVTVRLSTCDTFAQYYQPDPVPSMFCVLHVTGVGENTESMSQDQSLSVTIACHGHDRLQTCRITVYVLNSTPMATGPQAQLPSL